MNKTNIVMILSLLVLLLISIQVYRLFSELPTQTVTQQPTPMVVATKQETNLVFPPSHNKPTTTKTLEPISTSLSCEGFERTINTFDRSRHGFIARIAANSFYNGADKMVILDTLMAKYGIETAVSFVRNISSISPTHESFKKTQTKA